MKVLIKVLLGLEEVRRLLSDDIVKSLIEGRIFGLENHESHKKGQTTKGLGS